MSLGRKKERKKNNMENNYLQIGKMLECSACHPEKYQSHMRDCNCACHVKQIIKLIEKWQFAECPTEEKEPFFWRWTSYGKEQLAEYISELLNKK